MIEVSEIQHHVKFLKDYNLWRRGDSPLPQPCPREVGKALDKVCEVMDDFIQEEISHSKRIKGKKSFIEMEAGGWFLVANDCLPPMETPVWLYLPDIQQPIIGCRTEEGGEWFWARCYGDFWFGGHWRTNTADMDDLSPSHWMLLPQPPDKNVSK